MRLMRGGERLCCETILALLSSGHQMSVLSAAFAVDAGAYFNWLCQKSHLPDLLDLDIRFFRDCHNSGIVPCYPPINLVKATLWKPIRRGLVPTLKLRKRIAA